MFLFLSLFIFNAFAYYTKYPPTTCQQASKICSICLTNKDFRRGTYRAKVKNQKICIGEDIVFDPDSGKSSVTTPNVFGSTGFTSFPADGREYPGSTDFTRGPYALGFFAAMTIEADGISVNLLGHTLAMSKSFYVQQRFFALIEIGNTPFVPGDVRRDTGPSQGPNDFLGSQKVKKVKKITISNGILGLSSHHGVHANFGSEIVLQRLHIEQFEVGGAQFNGCNKVQLLDMEVGPSNQNVPVRGFYSSARYLLGLFMKKRLYQYTTQYVNFYNGRKSYNTLFRELRTVTDIAYRFIMSNGKLSSTDANNKLWKDNKYLFINDNDQLPDGSSIYGLIFNNHGVGVLGYGESSNVPHSHFVLVRDVKVHNLKLKTNEIPVMLLNKCNNPNAKNFDISFAMKGPFGDIMDIRNIFSSKDRNLIDEGKFNDVISRTGRTDSNAAKYVGNVIANAQIGLGIAVESPISNLRNNIFGTNVNVSPNSLWGKRTNYDKHPLLSWVFRNRKLNNCVNKFMCNGDCMLHTNKGIMGIRFDQIENIRLENVLIDGLHNKAPIPSFACKNYSGVHDGGNPFQLEEEGSLSGDVRGISFIESDIITHRTRLVNVKNLLSDYGDVTGVHVQRNSLLSGFSSIKVDTSSLQSGKLLTRSLVENLFKNDRIPYPNNFANCPYIVERNNRARIAVSGLDGKAQELLTKCHDTLKVKFCNDENKRFDDNGKCVNGKAFTTDKSTTNSGSSGNSQSNCAFQITGSKFSSHFVSPGSYSLKSFSSFRKFCVFGSWSVANCVKKVMFKVGPNSKCSMDVYTVNGAKVSRATTSITTSSRAASKSYSVSSGSVYKVVVRKTYGSSTYGGTTSSSSSSSSSSSKYTSSGTLKTGYGSTGGKSTSSTSSKYGTSGTSTYGGSSGSSSKYGTSSTSKYGGGSSGSSGSSSTYGSGSSSTSNKYGTSGSSTSNKYGSSSSSTSSKYGSSGSSGTSKYGGSSSTSKYGSSGSSTSKYGSSGSSGTSKYGGSSSTSKYGGSSSTSKYGSSGSSTSKYGSSGSSSSRSRSSGSSSSNIFSKTGSAILSLFGRK